MRFRSLITPKKAHSCFTELIGLSNCNLTASINSQSHMRVGFDWHGTLFQLYPHHFLDPLNMARAAFGHPPFKDLSESKSVIESLAQAAEVDLAAIKANPEGTTSERQRLNLALDIYKASYRSNVLSPCGLLPGVEETLKALKSQGIELFIISNHMQDLLADDVRKIGLSKYFKYIIGAQDPSEYKPSVLMFKRLFNTMTPSTGTTYYVGDQPSDIKAAQQSGCKAILVSERQIANFEPRPDYWISKLPQLKKLMAITTVSALLPAR